VRCLLQILWRSSRWDLIRYINQSNIYQWDLHFMYCQSAQVQMKLSFESQFRIPDGPSLLQWKLASAISTIDVIRSVRPRQRCCAGRTSSVMHDLIYDIACKGSATAGQLYSAVNIAWLQRISYQGEHDIAIYTSVEKNILCPWRWEIRPVHCITLTKASFFFQDQKNMPVYSTALHTLLIDQQSKIRYP
jgi:hypothetical protein